MPHEQMNEQQLAAYLHLDAREVVKLASRGAIPCRKVRDGFVFRKGQIDHWVWERMHTLDRGRLAGIERGVSAHHGFDAEALAICPLIPAGGVAVPLGARTREAALRALVQLADEAGLVYHRDDLLEELRQRESLCPTSLFPGVAVPHPRKPLPYDLAASFVVVGVTAGGIPYGATDGSLTRLFFLMCCKDERTHLHVLARLARILYPPGAIDELVATESPEQFDAVLLKLEETVLEQP